MATVRRIVAGLLAASLCMSLALWSGVADSVVGLVVAGLGGAIIYVGVVVEVQGC